MLRTCMVVALVSLCSSLASSSEDSNAAVSPFSGLGIPTECLAAYQKGITSHQKALEEAYNFEDYISREAFYERVTNDENFSEDCQFYISLGLHDAQSLIRLQIDQEFMLEYREAKGEQILATRAWQTLVGHYEDRLRKIGLDDPTDIEMLMKDEALIEQSNAQLIAALQKIADQEQEAVPFGRFLFVGRAGGVQTVYDYNFRNDGSFRRDARGAVVLSSGSYQRGAKALYDGAVTNAKEYLQWRPSLFYGEDAYWRGALPRYFSSDNEPTVRDIKEDMYLGTMRSYLNQARRLRLDTEPLFDMYQTMLKKQSAILERDIAVYDKTETALLAAPLVPLGMYVGAGLMLKTGWLAAMPATTGTFTYLGGSLTYAANSSALVSLTVIGGYVGIGGYNAWQARQDAKEHGLPFSLTDAADMVVFAGLESFQLAAIAPVAVGGLMYGGQQGWIAGRTLLTNAIQSGRMMAQAGLRQTAATLGQYVLRLPGQAVKLPGFLVREWVKAWWKNPKLLFTHYGADVLITVGYECGYRQVSRNGERKCWYTDQDGSLHINDHFLYKLGAAVIVSPLSKPLVLIPTFGQRYLAYASFYAFADVLIHLAISGEIDEDRFFFDRVYNNTVGTLTSEVTRSFKLSEFVTSKSVPSQIALIIMFKVLATRPITMPLDLALFEAYEAGHISDCTAFRDLVNKYAMVDLSEYSDDEIQNAALEFSDTPLAPLINRDLPETSPWYVRQSSDKSIAMGPKLPSRTE